MILWIDDKKKPEFASLFGILEQEEWHWEKTAQGARSWLFHPDPKYRPIAVAIDNDLGLESTHDGRDLAHQILERVLDDRNYMPPERMYCISYNPVAEDEIKATFADIRKAMELREAP